MDFDFFGKKSLKKASLTGATTSPQDDEKSNINIGKLAEENAKQKLNNITGAPSTPPIGSIAIGKPVVKKKPTFMGPIQSK